MMRARADQTGIVFDIYEDQTDRFLEISQHLRETDSKTDFEIIKCTELPPLDDEGGDSMSSGGGWRGGSGSSTTFEFGKTAHGGPRHGRH